MHPPFEERASPTTNSCVNSSHAQLLRVPPTTLLQSTQPAQMRNASWMMSLMGWGLMTTMIPLGQLPLVYDFILQPVKI